MNTGNKGMSLKVKIELGFLAMVFLAGGYGLIAGMFGNEADASVTKSQSAVAMRILSIEQLTDADRETVAKAADALISSCPQISKYWSDVESATAELSDAYYRPAQDANWNEHVLIQLKLSNSPAKIPSSYRAWGHTCYYYVGEGSELGMFTNKEPCEKLCGLNGSGTGMDNYMKLDATK